MVPPHFAEAQEERFDLRVPGNAGRAVELTGACGTFFPRSGGSSRKNRGPPSQRVAAL